MIVDNRFVSLVAIFACNAPVVQYAHYVILPVTELSTLLHNFVTVMWVSLTLKPILPLVQLVTKIVYPATVVPITASPVMLQTFELCPTKLQMCVIVRLIILTMVFTVYASAACTIVLRASAVQAV
jgi:hypothetical protein